MKQVFLFFFLTIGILVKAQVNPPDSIAPYVSFLQKQQVSAKDYIINLFDRYDIVVFCERFHEELTQYKLLIDVIGDKRFREKAGNVYMEIGCSNFDTIINNYLSADGLSDEQSKNAAIKIQRDMMWYPLWARYNYHFFLTSLYKINKALSKNEKIRLHPADIAVDWKAIKTVDDIRKKIAAPDIQDGRDSVMAVNIISSIEKTNATKTKRKKYFVILNTAHATKGIWTLDGYKTKSAASYLFDKYPGKTANVLINMESVLNMYSTQSGLPETLPILNGKWDAAFEFLGIDNRGFDIKGSPLGNQRFENMAMADPDATNDNIFTGYVFYKPFPEHELVNGVPGLVDGDFRKEYIRRMRLWDQLDGSYHTDEQLNEFADQDNHVADKRPEGLSAYWQKVEYWINGGKQIIAFYTEADSIEATVAFIKTERAKGSRSEYNVSESGINNFGYYLMRRNKDKDALVVFQLNTGFFPNAWNTWDSLGECLAKLGRKEEAIEAYKRSIELNPKNESGKKTLERIMSEH